MADRVNRRDQIVTTASELFRKHGYATTSVRQIAEEVGVTEAALYYHFKDGKRELLREVFECEMPDLLAVLGQCETAETLDEMLQCFAVQMSQHMIPRLDQLRWIMSEFPTMDAEEKALFHKKQATFHHHFVELLSHFVDDKQDVQNIAWLISLSLFGYGHLFINMELNQVMNFSPMDLMNVMSKALSAYINK